MLNRIFILLSRSGPGVGLLGAGGVKNFSVGIYDGALSTARSSFWLCIEEMVEHWNQLHYKINLMCYAPAKAQTILGTNQCSQISFCFALNRYSLELNAQ